MSMVIAPLGRSAPAIHCLRAFSGLDAGRNQLQSAPSSRRRTGCIGAPAAMAMAHPADVAILAAAILVAMPPDPTAEAEPPPIASISGVISRTSGIRRAVGSRFGSAV